jgi:hypothetical protein
MSRSTVSIFTRSLGAACVSSGPAGCSGGATGRGNASPLVDSAHAGDALCLMTLVLRWLGGAHDGDISKNHGENGGAMLSGIEEKDTA